MGKVQKEEVKYQKNLIIEVRHILVLIQQANTEQLMICMQSTHDNYDCLADYMGYIKEELEAL